MTGNVQLTRKRLVPGTHSPDARYEMEAYIREGLGITDEEVERLRQQLLD